MSLSYVDFYLLGRGLCLLHRVKKVIAGHSGENSTLVICQYERFALEPA